MLLRRDSRDGADVSVDNLAVRFSNEVMSAEGPFWRTWNNIQSVDMMSLRLSMNVIKPSFLRGDAKQDWMRRYLEADFPTLLKDGVC